jgi:hypothetical protein
MKNTISRTPDSHNQRCIDAALNKISDWIHYPALAVDGSTNNSIESLRDTSA